MPPRRAWSLDPIVLFLILGSGLVGLHALTRSEPEPDVSRTIVVTDADVAVIHEGFLRRRMRPPTTAEMRALVDRHVRDEILYREAVALGLDREDPALKRRLATKLEYLAKNVGAAVEPTEAELRAFFEKNAQRYALEPRRRYQHIFLSEDKRGERAVADARDLLVQLSKTDTPDLPDVGDPLLLEGDQPHATEAAVGRDFGPEFAKALFTLEPGTWQGPIASGYGLHLVRVLEAVPGEAPALAAVLDAVRSDLLTQRRNEASASYLGALNEKYEVIIRATLPEPEAP